MIFLVKLVVSLCLIVPLLILLQCFKIKMLFLLKGSLLLWKNYRNSITFLILWINRESKCLFIRTLIILCWGMLNFMIDGIMFLKNKLLMSYFKMLLAILIKFYKNKNFEFLFVCVCFFFCFLCAFCFFVFIYNSSYFFIKFIYIFFLYIYSSIFNVIFFIFYFIFMYLSSFLFYCIFFYLIL
jgi:hypothetical protein